MQYRTLRTTHDPIAKGNALRYLLHFIGDLHQPLHTTTNGDRGGNGMPVPFSAQRRSRTPGTTGGSNLHAVWDDGLIRHVMSVHGLADSRAFADYIIAQAPTRPVSATTATPARVAKWARESASRGASPTASCL